MGDRDPLSPGRGRPLPAPPGGGLSPSRGNEGRAAARGTAAEGRDAEPIGALVAVANGGGRHMAGAVGGGRARREAGAALAVVTVPHPASFGPAPAGMEPSQVAIIGR